MRRESEGRVFFGGRECMQAMEDVASESRECLLRQKQGKIPGKTVSVTRQTEERLKKSDGCQFFVLSKPQEAETIQNYLRTHRKE